MPIILGTWLSEHHTIRAMPAGDKPSSAGSCGRIVRQLACVAPKTAMEQSCMKCSQITNYMQCKCIPAFRHTHVNAYPLGARKP